MGIDFTSPDRCVDDGGMRGQWDVPDTTCLATPPPAPARGGDGQLRSTAPLEGFADLHLHQMSNLGFGGSIVWGAAFGPPEQVLVPIPQAMKLGHDRSEALFDGNIAGGVIGLTSHGESGFPGFTTWPSRELATHQQAYEDWLFRAYQSGLRLMVMLAVNSEDMFGRGENDLPLIGGVAIQGVRAPGRSTNDMETLEWQVREAYRMQTYIDGKHGGPGKGWYRIVRDPDEASAVIAGGRLAVVLGTELQHLFNCDSDRPACSEATIVEGLNRLEAMGVAHVFPIHHKLNQFGGPTQFNPLTNGPTEECFETEERCSSVGLTPLGKFLIEELTTRGMLVDTEHMSWKALDDTLAIVEARRYPVVASHVGPFDLKADGFQNEQVRRTDQLRRMLAVGGMLGVIYGVGVEEYAPSKTARVQVPISCGGADRWATPICTCAILAGDGGLAGTGDRLGGRVTIGSDWNGFAGWPGPRFGPEPCQARTARDGKPIAKPAPVGIPGGAARPAGAGGAEPGGDAAPHVAAAGVGLQRSGPAARRPDGGVHGGPAPRRSDPGGSGADLPVGARGGGAVADGPGPGGARRSPPAALDAAQPVRRAGLRIRRRRTLRGGGPGAGAVPHAAGASPGGRARWHLRPCGRAAAPVAAAPEEITAYHAGRCLDVDGQGTGDGARVQQYACNGGGNQRWQVRAVGDRWEIAGMASGKCLQTGGDGAGSGATWAPARECPGSAGRPCGPEIRSRCGTQAACAWR
jgi:microsomal dipeptidase-like Zn-dependent dipeptidase